MKNGRGKRKEKQVSQKVSLRLVHPVLERESEREGEVIDGKQVLTLRNNCSLISPSSSSEVICFLFCKDLCEYCYLLG